MTMPLFLAKITRIDEIKLSPRKIYFLYFVTSPATSRSAAYPSRLSRKEVFTACFIPSNLAPAVMIQTPKVRGQGGEMGRGVWDGLTVRQIKSFKITCTSFR